MSLFVFYWVICHNECTFFLMQQLDEAKKTVLFPEIGQAKNFLSLTRPIVECVSEYIFFVLKKTHTNGKAKQTK